MLVVIAVLGQGVAALPSKAANVPVTPFEAVFAGAKEHRGHEDVIIDDYRVDHAPDGSAAVVLWQAHDADGEFEFVLLGQRGDRRYVGLVVEPVGDQVRWSAFSFTMAAPLSVVTLGTGSATMAEDRTAYWTCLATLGGMLGVAGLVVDGVLATFAIGGASEIMTDGVCAIPEPMNVFWEGMGQQNVKYKTQTNYNYITNVFGYRVEVRGCDPVLSGVESCYRPGGDIFGNPQWMSTSFLAEHIYTDGRSELLNFGGARSVFYNGVTVYRHDAPLHKGGYVYKVMVQHMNELTFGQWISSGTAKAYVAVM